MLGKDIVGRLRREALERLPPALRERIAFYRAHGRLPALHPPETFNEKIVHRKLRDRNPLYAPYSDKYRVRAFVEERVGADVLVPLIASTPYPRDLLDLKDWRNAVFKPNHGSRMVMIFGVEQPDRAVREAAIATFERWLARDYSRAYGEPHYAAIPPRMVVERRIGDGAGPLTEWKAHCFRQRDGSFAMVLQVISDRFGSKSMSYHDCTRGTPRLMRLVEGKAPMFDTAAMSMLASVLSASRDLADAFDYVRVDWFVTDDRFYFSELTFTPGAGLSKTLGPDLDRIMGALWYGPARGSVAARARTLRNPLRPSPNLSGRTR